MNVKSQLLAELDGARAAVAQLTPAEELRAVTVLTVFARATRAFVIALSGVGSGEPLRVSFDARQLLERGLALLTKGGR